MFLLHLKERKSLSQAAVKKVVESQRLFKHTIGHVQAGVSREGLVSSDIPSLDTFFANVHDPFDGLTSKFLQEKYFKEEIQCIVSINFKLWYFIHGIWYKNLVNSGLVSEHQKLKFKQ